MFQPSLPSLPLRVHLCLVPLFGQLGIDQRPIVVPYHLPSPIVVTGNKPDPQSGYQFVDLFTVIFWDGLCSAKSVIPSMLPKCSPYLLDHWEREMRWRFSNNNTNFYIVSTSFTICTGNVCTEINPADKAQLSTPPIHLKSFFCIRKYAFGLTAFWLSTQSGSGLEPYLAYIFPMNKMQPENTGLRSHNKLTTSVYALADTFFLIANY